MARGWESKAVEEQVQEFSSKSDEQPKKNGVTAEEAESARRKKVQQLSLARVRSQLDTCQDPRYREQLSRALADLEKLIAENPSL